MHAGDKKYLDFHFGRERQTTASKNLGFEMLQPRQCYTFLILGIKYFA